MLNVSDTSPIINLARIGHLHLLPALFSEIVLPPAVFHEIVVQGSGDYGAEEIAAAEWVKVIPVADLALLEQLNQILDPGESEAIALAVELHADYVLMDESEGRSIAQQYHLKPLGLLGILLRAKSTGIVSSVRELMDQLRREANFFIDKDLYEFVLKTAEE